MNNFQILSELGTGSFGKVNLAIHSCTGEKVAIKTISKQKLKSKEDFQMVNKQIAVFKTVQHPHIIKLYQIIEDSTSLYLVMEHADRGDLLTYIKQDGTLSQHLALLYMKQLAQAVAYLHCQKNIAHRDIKLANILLCSKQSRIKLADFGLSNFYQKDKLLKTSCGSPCYSAPQILLGSKYSPLPADIWSLGVVLYAMVQGCLPFYNENAKQLYKQVVKGKYCQHEKASHQIQQLIRKMLQINPDSRTGIHQLIKQINLLLGQQSIKQNSIKTVPKLTKQSHDYVQYLRIQHMKKILVLKGFQECIVQSSFQYLNKYNKPRKFNDLNTYMELLNKIPINKLSNMLQILHNESKVGRSFGDESSLKRNYSSFTRDTLKGSQAQEKAPNKIRFVRNAVPNNKNIKLTQSQGNKKIGKKEEQPKKVTNVPVNAKHRRKRSDLIMSLNTSEFENNGRVSRNTDQNQIKCGYIRLSNLETQRQKNFIDLQIFNLRTDRIQQKQKNHHLSLSLSKQSSNYQNSTNADTQVNQSVNQSMSMATQRSYTHRESQSSEIPIYRGLFNIMHTFNGNLNEQLLLQNLKKKFEDIVIINNYKYFIKDDENESHQVQIVQVQNFRYLKLVKISPNFNMELFNKIKPILHQSTLTK